VIARQYKKHKCNFIKNGLVVVRNNQFLVAGDFLFCFWAAYLYGVGRAGILLVSSCLVRGNVQR
jgi:hypothetical protein